MIKIIKSDDKDFDYVLEKIYDNNGQKTSDYVSWCTKETLTKAILYNMMNKFILQTDEHYVYHGTKGLFQVRFKYKQYKELTLEVILNEFNTFIENIFEDGR